MGKLYFHSNLQEIVVLLGAIGLLQFTLAMATSFLVLFTITCLPSLKIALLSYHEIFDKKVKI